MRLRAATIALLAASAVLLSACGGGTVTPAGAGSGSESAAINESKAVDENKAADSPKIEAAPVEVADTLDGVNQLGSLTKDFKQAIEAGDDAKWQELSRQIAGVWEAIKSDVQAKSGDSFPELEQKVNEFLAAAAASKADKDLLIQQDYELYQQFRDLGKVLTGEAVQAN
ncbi:hypothetical protein [Paenibacillus methanolicus]|uniref:Lipoprotein n=1 Tax=Paenibacillus methanolicus TaxID=582686 RepID=A0A5S5BTX3_9BACL|nr:hypothetical protein [Paenibacillus methanolicus]TYP70625.1 hypothetical protein BCM02_111131 [Paenibacillus methanolicus]